MGNSCQPVSLVKKLRFTIPEKEMWEKVRDYSFDLGEL